MRTTVQSRTGITAALARGGVIGLVLSGVFIAGFLFRGVLPPSITTTLAHVQDVPSVVGQYPLLTEVQTRLNENYLRPQPDQKQLEYAAIRGLVGALNDKYTFFVDPPVAHSESDVLAGKYGGIGVQVKRDETGNYVLYPFRDGPAAKAGVQDGDVLLKGNGK